MKRLTLLTILLVVVGLTAGFALEVKPSFTLSGYGKVEWGIDLNDFSTGFKNTTEADLMVALFAEDTSDTHKGEGDWYGEIKLSDIELWATATNSAQLRAAGDHLGVSAKIVGLGGKLAIGVYGDPDLGSNVDFVASIENDEDDDYKVVDDETSVDEDDLGVDYAGGGTYVSYALSDALTVGLEAVSEFDWVANNDQAYALALDILATFAPLTVTAGVNYGFNYVAAEQFGFGVKVAADTDMVDGWVGFDGALDGGFDFEVGGGVTATLAEGVTADVAVAYGAGIAAFEDIDVKFVFTEPGAAGLMDNFDLTVTVWFLDLMDDMEYEVIVDGGYKMGVWYPNFNVDFGDDVNMGDEGTEAAILGQFMNVSVGIDYTGIPLTTLGLYYKNNDFLASTVDIGDIVFSAKVAY